MKVGIIGATGYAGGELVRILAGHPEAKLVRLGSRKNEGEPYSDSYGNIREIVELSLSGEDLGELSEECDVIFTATPQGYLGGVLTEDILKKTKVIDLSADYRIDNVPVYEKWYGITHQSPQLIKQAVYGLPEIHREDTKGKSLVANPGCFPTCSILSVYPMVKEGIIDLNSIIIDAKSGVSGAGRGAKAANLYCEVNENMKAYGVAAHRHTPEIEEQLSLAAKSPVMVSFTPHLAPMNRGILATAYATLKKDVTKEEVREIYNSYYEKEQFVRVLPEGKCPETRFVEGSNYCDVNFVVDQRTGRIIMMGAIDNLMKGAAGQAVQNMNILFGLPENTGLTMVPVFP